MALLRFRPTGLSWCSTTNNHNKSSPIQRSLTHTHSLSLISHKHAKRSYFPFLFDCVNIKHNSPCVGVVAGKRAFEDGIKPVSQGRGETWRSVIGVFFSGGTFTLSSVLILHPMERHHSLAHFFRYRVSGKREIFSSRCVQRFDVERFWVSLLLVSFQL